MNRLCRFVATLPLSFMPGLISTGLAQQSSAPSTLPGTRPLTWDDDIASRLVAGVDRFLLKELEASTARRAAHWHRDLSSPEAYNASIAPNRERLAHIIGLRDERVPFEAVELVGTTAQPARVGRGENFDVYAVRWPAFGDVHGEGLLLRPTGRSAVADVVAIPDADQTPEMIVGLTDGVAPASQFARRLAESGCRVLVPVLINRELKPRGVPGRSGATLTNREYIYRSAFVLGRHLIGYEVRKVLTAVDWFISDADERDPPIGVVGYGEGGMIALYAAALDPRIDATCVSGYFDDRRAIWSQPIDRNVFGLLEQFGDAELAGMIAPRTLVIEAATGPEVTLPGKGGAPAQLLSPRPKDVKREFDRAAALTRGLKPVSAVLIAAEGGSLSFGSSRALEPFLTALRGSDRGESARRSTSLLAPLGSRPTHLREAFNSGTRQARQVHELDRHNQHVLRESAYVRKAFMSKLDTSSLEKYAETVEHYRRIFRDEVIGAFDHPRLPPNVRTRKAYETPKYVGYEVVMDVFEDVFAYGILLKPKGLRPGEKRPVVVCQHGLEGRPRDVVTGDQGAYHDYAARLAERGFVTFAPQNLYIFRDRFRTLQRKANPLKKTLFSIIVPQHQQITDWLATLDYVDPDRIAFYGLSYGGKTAMRVPPLVDRYCLSICAADFNEWVWKNASTRSPYSYVWTGEYEIFEFDLGSTFNYAEMAALIAPRPFMVERGHFDGVAPDETVAHEFAKVRFLYAARLGIGDRCEIEWFVGPHTINGKGTFDFLHKHLNWPGP